MFKLIAFKAILTVNILPGLSEQTEQPELLTVISCTEFITLVLTFICVLATFHGCPPSSPGHAALLKNKGWEVEWLNIHRCDKVVLGIPGLATQSS